jgi:hypothetical protein
MKRAAAALAFAAAPAAHAEPAIELARCTAFDAAKLRHAISRALPATAVPSSFAIVVDCPDLVTAHVHVEPAFADGPIARSLDLGEIAGDLRIQLLALAIVEVIEVAATARPAEVVADAPRTRRTYRDPRDPTPLADTEPREPAARTPDPKPVAAIDAHTSPRIATNAGTSPTSPTRRPVAPPAVATSDTPTAVDDTSPPPVRTWSISSHLIVRDFAATSTLLAGGGIELTLPWLRIGVDGAIGEVADPLGALQPWLVTASIAREIACAGHATQLCGLVRVAAGVAGVSARAPATVSARSTVAHYAQGGAVAELAHHFAGWSIAADAELAWADGVIARAGGRDAAALAGVTMTGGLGVRWR